MRIGIDIRSLQQDDRFRGIGAYVASLVQTIARIDRKHKYLVYAWDDSDPLQMLGIPSQGQFRLVLVGHRPLRITAGRLRNCLLRDIRLAPGEVDVFLQPNAMSGLPWGGIPNAAVAYDLIPLIFPTRYWPRPSVKQVRESGLRSLLRSIPQRWLYRWGINQLTSAGRIIAISNATERDLLRYFPRLHGKVAVTRLACDPQFQPVSDTAPVLAKWGIVPPFLLYVGGVDFRKNVTALLGSYDRLREGGHALRLVLVGREFGFREHDHPDLLAVRDRIDGSRFSTDIRRVGFVERSDLVALYSAAAALVFPSLYEGFGLPILEAMACGCPVVAYRTSSIPEVAGTAAILLDPPQDLAGGVVRLLHNEQERRARIAAGFAQAAKFSWERTVSATLGILEEMVAAENRHQRPG